MGTRESILERTRNRHLENVVYPTENYEARAFRNPERIFREFLSAAHGEWKEFPSLITAIEFLPAWERLRDAKSICDLTETLKDSRLPLHAAKDVDSMSELDLVVAMGKIGVAENGAVWVEPPNDARTALFLAKHLLIFLPREKIVSSMHDAYSLLDLESINYGTFIAGPSKTADIAQKLVLGAHGPLSVTVFGYDNIIEAGI
jgi:L-lactate dehydrogenase complex protein LldG